MYQLERQKYLITQIMVNMKQKHAEQCNAFLDNIVQIKNSVSFRWIERKHSMDHFQLLLLFHLPYHFRIFDPQKYQKNVTKFAWWNIANFLTFLIKKNHFLVFLMVKVKVFWPGGNESKLRFNFRFWWRKSFFGTFKGQKRRQS